MLGPMRNCSVFLSIDLSISGLFLFQLLGYFGRFHRGCSSGGGVDRLGEGCCRCRVSEGVGYD